jgi:hypothetical protein
VMRSRLTANCHRLSCTLINSHQLWADSKFDESLRYGRGNISESSCNSVLVWPGHESWENSRANFPSSTLILVWPRLKIFLKRIIIAYLTVAAQRQIIQDIEMAVEWYP